MKVIEGYTCYLGDRENAHRTIQPIHLQGGSRLQDHVLDLDGSKDH
jgi:hypothetical protein